MKSAVLIFLGFVAALALFSNAASVRAAKDKGVIRVETRLIEVNVVARDSHGHPVEGLTKDDFRLYDNGKRVPLDVFSAISAKPQTAKPLPPNEYSNRLPGAPPSVTVVLLDGLNTSFPDQNWARTQVVQFLEALKPRDRVAIFLLGSHLFVLQNFTSDPRLLLAALKGHRIQSPKEIEASNIPVGIGGSDQPPPLVPISSAGTGAPTSGGTTSGNSASAAGAAGGAAAGASAGASQAAAGEAADEARMEQVMLELQEHESSFFMTDRVNRTAAALMAIARYLAHFPGRKNLIWVSAAFPMAIGFMRPRELGNTRDQIVYTEPLDKAYKALNNADIAVYPVDARGLVAGTSNRFYSSLGTMQELAAKTGGRAFYNTNDLVRPMQAAMDDYQADYTLGFYPHDIRWNGRYHTLKVKVVTHGVHLRYRKGYYATPETPPKETQTNVALDRAIYAPLDSTGLGLRVTVLNSVPAPDSEMELAINMDAHDMKVQSGTAGRFVNLAVVLAQSNAEGKVVHTDGYNMKLQVAAGGIPNLMKTGFKVTKWVQLVKGADTLDVVVRDPASGNIGSVRLPVRN